MHRKPAEVKCVGWARAANGRYPRRFVDSLYNAVEEGEARDKDRKNNQDPKGFAQQSAF